MEPRSTTLGAGPLQDTQTLPALGLKPAVSLRRHWRAGLVAMALVIVAGLPLAWIKGKSTYTTESVFQVAPTFMKNLEADRELELQSNTQYREFVNQLSSSVVRHDVIERALQALRARGIDQKPLALTERKYIEKLRKAIWVRPIADTYMVRIGVDDADPRHLHDLVNAVTDDFIATTRREQIFGTPQRLEQLQLNDETLRREIAELEQQRVALAARLGLTGFRENAENPFDATLAQARERANAATVERIQAEATLDAYRANREATTALGRSLLEMRLQDTGLQSLRNEVTKRSEELLRAVDGLEPQHPVRQSATAELATLQQRLKAREAAFDREVRGNLEQRLVATVAQRRQVEQAVGGERQRIESQARDFASDFQLAMRLTGEIRQRDTDLTRLRQRLSYLDNESSAIGFVRLVSAALPAETPQGVGKTKLLLGALLAGAAAFLIVPIALDLLERRIRTVNEADKLMGFPAAGWQVDVTDPATAIFAEEQMRRFAAAIRRTRARGGQPVFAFTGVKPDAGVSTTVVNLARVLTGLGERVLVVDANTLSPHRPTGRDRPGLSDYLNGEGPASGLPRRVPLNAGGFDLVDVGTQAAKGLQRIDRFRDAVTTWSAGYDFVLVDLAPILISADAELLTEAIGQVFLVLDADGVSRGEVLRARRLLQKIDPEAVGSFVNRVSVFDGAGYLQSLVVETLTRRKFSDFNTRPAWRRWLDAWSLGWTRRRAARQAARAAAKRRG